MARGEGYLPWRVLRDVAKRDFIYAASRYPVRKLHWPVLRRDDVVGKTTLLWLQCHSVRRAVVVRLVYRAAGRITGKQ